MKNTILIQLNKTSKGYCALNFDFGAVAN